MARTSSIQDARGDETTPLLSRAVEKYSTFTGTQKTLIIFIAGLAGTFSQLSSNIYYPAMQSLERDFHVGDSLMNLTITAYMILQGVAPSFMGDLADTAGRRPVYILCFTTYTAANVALALQNSYWALLSLRALQSTGISATVALSNAVAADIVTSDERGMYLAIASFGSVLGPALGPTIGGILSQYWGWRSIFWFLAISSGTFSIPLLLFFPETCRKIVGNGSVPPPTWNKSLLNYMAERKQRHDAESVAAAVQLRDDLASKRKLRFPNPLSTLRLLFELPNGFILLCNGIGFAAYYAVTSSIPSQWTALYQLNELQLGLTYIPIGVGTVLSAFTNGWLIDRNFRRITRQVGAPPLRNGKQDLSEFPIEKARLQVAIPSAILGALSISMYGWMLEYEAPMPVALVLLFFIGYFVTACYNIMNVLIVDLNNDRPATATAANNLVRCLLGAGATATITPLLEMLGQGRSFVVISGAWMAAVPLTMLVYKRGLQWRQEREAAKVLYPGS